MVEWSKNPAYPTKRGVCSHCGSTDELKLSFDQIHFICLNAHACLLRWRKAYQEEGRNDEEQKGETEI